MRPRHHLLVALLLTAACGLPRRSVPPLPPTASPGQREVIQRLADVEQIVAGRLTRVIHDRRYDAPGSLIFDLACFVSERLCRTSPPEAYAAEVRLDSALTSAKPGSKIHFVFFAQPGNRRPEKDSIAIWLLHRRAVYPLRDCAEHGMSNASCPYDSWLALDGDIDVRPLAEWPEVEEAWRLISGDGKK